jgi:hypothetical protein
VNGKPTVGSGAKASLVGTTHRSYGKAQATYNALYLFVGDHNPGGRNGEGLSAYGDGWYAISSAGNRVAGQAPGGGSGYGY